MTFFKGFFTLKKKAYKKAVNGYVPKSVLIPLAQDSKIECNPVVKIGDKVEEGSLIGLLNDENVDYKIYSSVPGTVENIELCPTPNGSYSKAVKIKTGGKFNFLGKNKASTEWKSLTSFTIRNLIKEYGIINTFNTNFSKNLYASIEDFINSKGKFLVFRLFDDDVTRITDSLLANFYLDKILEASEILLKSTDAKGILFIVDKTFSETDKIKSDFPFEVISVDSKLYPNGFKEQIILEVQKKAKNSVFKEISKNDLFIDSSTACEVFRCVKYNMPVIDRFVHVSGECIHFSGLLKVSIGTSLRSLAEQCGGFVKQPAAIIINGLILGFSATNLDCPITKKVKSVSFLPLIRKPFQTESQCIRCGNCRRNCPLELSPDVLYRHAIGGQVAQIEYLKSSLLCTSCGLCNAFCPSRLPISQRILELKKKMQQKEVKNEKKL